MDTFYTKPELAFEKLVQLKFQLFNSLFLTLPFEGVGNIGLLLPIFGQYAQAGLKEEKSPVEIVNSFFKKLLPELSEQEQIDTLYRFIQYIERQISLFDALEDAAFEHIHQVNGQGSLFAFFNQLQNHGNKDALLEKLQNFSVRVVLTAHPTQFYPGQILSIITDLEFAIRNNKVEDINTLLQQLGQTPMFRREKPTPVDEAVSLIWYLENIFYTTVKQIYRQLIIHLGHHQFNKKLIALGFWPGGDRDGNPFVNQEVTLKTARRLRKAVLRCYQREISALKRRLTFAATFEKAAEIERKIIALNFNLNEPQYKDAKELINDLQNIRHILISQYSSLFLDEIDLFIFQVECFGFYFATLDIRQDSRIHRQVVADILEKNNLTSTYNQIQFESARIDFWNSLNLSLNPDDYEGISKDTIESIYAIKEIQNKNGAEACHRYIISNTRNAEDIFILWFLIRSCGYTHQNTPVDLIPLFETVSDLNACGSIMHTLYRHTLYKTHLTSRSNQQTIMLGFSDGTKDGGYLTANWEIYKAKISLTELSYDNGIKPVFFDGRGGPPARGGGDTHRFYASQGSRIANNEIQVTIQGQTISSKFGTHQSAKYNLEQLLTAGLSLHLFPDGDADFKMHEWQLMEEMSKLGLTAYTSLKEHLLFTEYLEQKTVLNLYSETNIGSRPAKRNAKSKLSLDDLRAIPFVGTWAQMKQNIPGFYGVGSAYAWFEKSNRTESIKLLYQKNPFFRALILNSMQAMAKSNFALTAYMKHDEKFADFWQMLKTEHEKSLNALLSLAGYKQLLEESKANFESIMMREHIVEPLLVIQQYALIKWQKNKKEEKLRKLIIRCFFGNINAGRNSA